MKVRYFKKIDDPTGSILPIKWNEDSNLPADVLARQVINNGLDSGILVEVNESDLPANWESSLQG